MIEKGIKNIIFDFGEVLINLNRQRCIDSFKKLGVNNVEELVNARQGFFMALEEGAISVPQFRNEVREAAKNASLTDRQIDEAWNSMLADLPSYKLDALLELRKQYRVFLLSNTNKIHWDWSLRHAFPYNGNNEKNYFEEIFLSYEMHLVKPGAEIFKAVINATGIKPEDTFFIDDSEANCKTAATLGITTHTASPGEDWRYLFNL